MGCAEERESFSSEQHEMASFEHLLGFYRLPSTLIDLTIRKYSSDQVITPPQLKHILKSLNLPGPHNPKSHPRVHRYYHSLIVRDNYSRQLLIVTGIILGQGEDSVKAELLFEAFNADASRMMEAKEFKEMWECLEDIAVVRLPALMSSPISEIEEYLTRLHEASQCASNSLYLELYPEEGVSVSLILFRYRILNSRMRCLLSPSGLRKYIEPFCKPAREKKAVMKQGKPQKSDSISERKESWNLTGEEKSLDS